MEMKVDAEAIEKSINALPGVCEDGKKAIKKIFEDGFGVEFKKEELFEVGAIYSNDGLPRILVKAVHEGKTSYHMIYLKDGSQMNSRGTLDFKGCNYSKTANSAEEYFRKKFEGKL